MAENSVLVLAIQVVAEVFRDYNCASFVTFVVLNSNTLDLMMESVVVLVEEY